MLNTTKRFKYPSCNVRFYVCICYTMSKDENGCSRKWLNMQNSISKATKFLNVCKDVTNATLLEKFVAYCHFSAINEFQLTL